MNIFMIAYYFPPDSSSGSFRPLFFANHLANSGSTVHVFTAKTEDYLIDQPMDDDLVAQIHPNVKITRCSVLRPREALLKFRAWFSLKSQAASENKKLATPFTPVLKRKTIYQRLKDIFTDIITTPDIHAGWIFDCIWQGRKAIAHKRPDVIYATGGPWSSLIAGALLKFNSGVPLVLDFRDPWTSNSSEKRRCFITRWINRRLESIVIKYADGIIANTVNLQKDFLVRYEKLNPRRITTITNGFEEYLPPSDIAEKHPLTIAHVGSLYSSRNPLPLIKAIMALIDDKTIHHSDLKIILVGEIETAGNEIAKLLSSGTLENVVEIIPRVPYKEATEFIRNSDVLLLIQPDFPLQIPRKLYDYMSARKLLLCIAERESSTGVLVRDYNLGVVCENNYIEIEQALKKLILLWKNGELSSYKNDHLNKFKNSELTVSLRTFINEIITKQI